MAKKQTSIDGYVIAECQRIATDPEETPARRRTAQKWLDRLTRDVPYQDGNGGQTVAEARGIEVKPGTPGGQKVDSPPGSPGVGHNESALGRQRYEYDGPPLSSEVSRSYRTGR
jgi:hypothetical protein